VNDFEPDEFLVAHSLMKVGEVTLKQAMAGSVDCIWSWIPRMRTRSILRLKLVCLPPNHRLTTLTVKDLSLSGIYSLILQVYSITGPLSCWLKTLWGADINIVAIHQHMTGENPQMIFLHAKDQSETVKRWLLEHDRWLLIADNADDLALRSSHKISVSILLRN
jgi:hypothetical protein